MQRAFVIRDRTYNKSDIVLDTEQLNEYLAKGWRVVSNAPLGGPGHAGKGGDGSAAVGVLVIIEKPDDELDEDLHEKPGMEPPEELDRERLEAMARELGKQLSGDRGKELDGPGEEADEDG